MQYYYGTVRSVAQFVVYSLVRLFSFSVAQLTCVFCFNDSKLFSFSGLCLGSVYSLASFFVVVNLFQAER